MSYEGTKSVMLYTYNFPCKYCDSKIVDIKKEIQDARGVAEIPFTVVYTKLFGSEEDREKIRKTFKDKKIVLNRMV